MTEPLAGSHGDTPADDAPLKKWAEYYLGLGLKPIPKRINEKAPAIRWKHWTKDYPRQADLDQWFDQDGVDGICLVLDGTDTVIIDCDGPRDRCLDLLAASDINIPEGCPEVITGRGHSNYFFYSTRQVKRRTKFLVDGDPKPGGAAIDLLGAGIVVVPPSPHPDTGKQYRWASPIHAAHRPALPPAAYRAAYPPHPSTSEPVGSPIREGDRERTLMSALGAARRQGVEESELRALAEAMNTRCKPPLDPAALDRMAQSVARYAPEPDDLHVAELVASAPPAGKKTPTDDLVFQTPVDLFATQRTHLDYVLAPYLIGDALTDFTGAAKAGKTRFRNYLGDVPAAVETGRRLGWHSTRPAAPEHHRGQGADLGHGGQRRASACRRAPSGAESPWRLRGRRRRPSAASSGRPASA